MRLTSLVVSGVTDAIHGQTVKAKLRAKTERRILIIEAQNGPSGRLLKGDATGIAQEAIHNPTKHGKGYAKPRSR